MTYKIKCSREDILAMRSFQNSSQRSHSSAVTIESWPTVNNLAEFRCENINRRSCAEKLIGFFMLLLAYFILWACFYRDVQVSTHPRYKQWKHGCTQEHRCYHCSLKCMLRNRHRMPTYISSSGRSH